MSLHQAVTPALCRCRHSELEHDDVTGVCNWWKGSSACDCRHFQPPRRIWTAVRSVLAWLR